MGTISVLGCGRTGMQATVFLMERGIGTVHIYDPDADYAKGMALDCMQAAAVQDGCARVVAVSRPEELAHADALIVCEYRDETNPSAQDVQAVSRAVPLCIVACRNADILKDLSSQSVFGAHGMADAALLRRAAADELDIDINDVQAMVRGGIGANMESSPDMVRVCGIPVDEIQCGAYDRALAASRTAYAGYNGGPWSMHYGFASAAVKSALFASGGQNALLPVTVSKNGKPCSIIARVHAEGYEELRV